jgi:hypothetical protein
LVVLLNNLQIKEKQMTTNNKANNSQASVSVLGDMPAFLAAYDNDNCNDFKCTYQGESSTITGITLVNDKVIVKTVAYPGGLSIKKESSNQMFSWVEHTPIATDQPMAIDADGDQPMIVDADNDQPESDPQPEDLDQDLLGFMATLKRLRTSPKAIVEELLSLEASDRLAIAQQLASLQSRLLSTITSNDLGKVRTASKTRSSAGKNEIVPKDDTENYKKHLGYYNQTVGEDAVSIKQLADSLNIDAVGAFTQRIAAGKFLRLTERFLGFDPLTKATVVPFSRIVATLKSASSRFTSIKPVAGKITADQKRCLELLWKGLEHTDRLTDALEDIETLSL